MNYDCVEICKTVSALEAGRALGLDINHSGRCKCPYHGGKDYNMKLYAGDRGFYCFVCHAQGDVIELVQRTLSITFVDAVKWLSDEFHLNVDIDKPASRKTIQRAKEQAKKRRELEAQAKHTERNIYGGYLSACDLVRKIDRIIEMKAPKPEDEEWDEAFCKALKLKTAARELLDRYTDMMMEG